MGKHLLEKIALYVLALFTLIALANGRISPTTAGATGFLLIVTRVIVSIVETKP